MPGLPAVVASRGLLAGAFFGMDALLPLTLTAVHGYSPTAAGIPLTAGAHRLGDGVAPAGPPPRRSPRERLLRVGFAAAGARPGRHRARRRCPALGGWPAYPSWAVAGLGMGLGMPSVGVLLLDQSPEHRRGADSAALQIADVTASALCIGLAGVLVAAATARPAVPVGGRRRLGRRSPCSLGVALASGVLRRRPGRPPRATRRRTERASHADEHDGRMADDASEGQVTYLDHAATTPVLPEVLAAMTEQLGRVGNASSLHASGRAARRAAEQSRERLAEALGARPSEVLFTGGGTESDNLAVKGLFWARRQADSRRRRIVVSPAEHHAVLDSVEWLAKHDGAEVTWLPVEPTGRVTPGGAGRGARRRHATSRVASVMWANNEIGTVSDIAGAGRGRARGRASRCTPTRCRRSGRCRSTSARAASTR